MALQSGTPQRVLYGLLTALTLLGLAPACSNEDATRIDGNGDANGNPNSGAGKQDEGSSELYAYVVRVRTPEDSFYYVGTMTNIEAEVDFRQEGIEFAGDGRFHSFGGSLYYAAPDTPTITRFTVGDDNELEEAETLSFAGVGVSTTSLFTIVSAEKAYVVDRDNYTVQLWDPTEMVLLGKELDYSEAFHDDGRDPPILRVDGPPPMVGDTLFLFGGWSTADFATALVIAIDTVNDTLEVHEDERCGFLNYSTVADNGDIYWFTQGLPVAIEAFPPCALATRNGETDFDDAYRLLLANLLPDNHMVSGGYPGMNDTVYMSVVDRALLDGETWDEQRRNALNDYRLWKFDLVEETAEMVDSIGAYNSADLAMQMGSQDRALGDPRAIVPVRSLIDPNNLEAGRETFYYEVLTESTPVLTDIPVGSVDPGGDGQVGEVELKAFFRLR